MFVHCLSCSFKLYPIGFFSLRSGLNLILAVLVCSMKSNLNRSIPGSETMHRLKSIYLLLVPEHSIHTVQLNGNFSLFAEDYWMKESNNIDKVACCLLVSNLLVFFYKLITFNSLMVPCWTSDNMVHFAITEATQCHCKLRTHNWFHCPDSSFWHISYFL